MVPVPKELPVSCVYGETAREPIRAREEVMGGGRASRLRLAKTPSRRRYVLVL